MRTNLAGTRQLIRLSRQLRPAVDCLLLAACLGACMLIQQYTLENNLNTPMQARIAQTLNQQKPRAQVKQSLISIDQQFESEPAMWSGFQTWLVENASSQGHCSFVVVAVELPYRMQCTGGHRDAQSDNRAAKLNLPQVFGVVLVPSTSKSLSTPKQSINSAIPEPRTEKKTYPVEGWIDTPQGRRHFDPVAKRWKP